MLIFCNTSVQRVARSELSGNQLEVIETGDGIHEGGEGFAEAHAVGEVKMNSTDFTC